MTLSQVKVVLVSSECGHFTAGAKEFALDARSLHDVIKTLDARYPGLGEYLEEEASVAIDGEIHEVVYSLALRPGSEIYFIPKIEGG